MSYEGYSQLWCKNGHYWTVDCYELDYLEPEDYPKCPVCKEKFVFENRVDLTNGSFDDWDNGTGERIDGWIKPELIEPHKIKCKHCGKEHLCECSVYKIPKKEKWLRKIIYKE